MSQTPPIIGNWYRDLEQDAQLEVVAIDEASGTVEVQYADGAIDEFEREQWWDLPLLPCSAPEDSEAPFEVGPEDRWYDDGHAGETVHNPLAFIEPDSFPGFDDFY